MAPQNLRLVWGNPPVPAGRWHAGLVNLKIIPSTRNAPAASPTTLAKLWHDHRRHRLHLSLRGLLVWAAGAAFFAYLAGAAVLHDRLERASAFNHVTYLDLALPTRWAGLDRLRGQALIAEGRSLLSGRRFNEGFSLLRLGLARHPADHQARLVLAQIYTSLRLAPQADKLLRDGLDHGYPGRASLEFSFSLAADADQPAHWLELCQLARARFDALPPDARPTDDSLWLDEQTVRALLANEHSAETLALVESRYPETHPFRREITILHLLAAGRAAEAATLAARWADQLPRAPEPLHLLVRARREAGDHPGMDSALDRLRALEPAKPDALLYALAQHQLAARPDSARAALEAILLRHGANPNLYATLATVFVECRDRPSLDRLEAELRERGLPLRPVHWSRLQLATANRDWPAVLAAANTLRAPAPAPALSEEQTAWLETAARLAQACLDASSGTQASLVEIIADRPGTLRLYKLILEALLDAGRASTARQILTLAEGPYATSVTLAALRPRLETALAASALAATPESPDTSASTFSSVEVLEAAFVERIRNKDTDGALAVLAAARRARPAWFADSELRLDALELPLRARGDDPLRLQLLARGALARDTRAPDELLALARAINAESPAHRAHAALLVKEILRHAPGHAAALAQLAAWEPRSGRAPLDAAP